MFFIRKIKMEAILIKPQKKFVFKRFCSGCGKYFQPTGKRNMKCKECLKVSSQNNPRHKRLKRPCKGCDEMFTPFSKFNIYCTKCLEEREEKRVNNYHKSINNRKNGKK